VVKKSLKIPKGLSESINRRPDNKMATRKGTNNDLQTKDQVTQNPLKTVGVLEG